MQIDTAKTRRVPHAAHWGAFNAVTEDGRLVACEPFEKDPAPSAMLGAIVDGVYSPKRISAPAVRHGWLENREKSDGRARGSERFVEVSWEEALDLVSEELSRVRAESGAEAILGGSYGWSSAGRLHHARSLVRRFLFAGGGCVDQVGNYSWGTAQFLLPHVIGTYAPLTGRVTSWPNLISNTEVFVAFGGIALKNGQVTSGGAGEHTLEKWLRQAVKANVRFINVSPYRSHTPEFLGAKWIPIRPNTDTALMLGLAYLLASESAHDTAFLASHCTGYERFEEYLLGAADGVPKDPRWASSITGVDAEVIIELAREISSHRTFLSATYSLQRAHHGEQPYWMLVVLAAMIGQIGLPGGGFGFGHGSMNGVGNPRSEASGPQLRLGPNPVDRSIPVARIADMLLSPGQEYDFNGHRDIYPNIRLVYWAGGNPFHHHQDINKLREAWSRPETVVVHDIWWTPTAQRADIVLPATTSLERNDIGGSSSDRYILAMHQVIEPVGLARNDFSIFRDLAARGGFEAAFTEGKGEKEWIEHIYAEASRAQEAAGNPMPSFDAFWKKGFVELSLPSDDFVLLSDFRTDPIRNTLKTPSGRIEIYSETIASFGYTDCGGHPAWLEPNEWLGGDLAAEYPIHLLTVQPADKLHSQLDFGPVSGANKVAECQAIHIHPSDAARRGLVSGDTALVFNRRGSCLAGVVTDGDLLPGVAIMATGAWYSPQHTGRNPLDVSGNPNVLTNDNGTSSLSQGPNAMSVLVEILPHGVQESSSTDL